MANQNRSLLWLLLGGYSLTCLLYALFSYSLTDPNLVLLQWQPYWNFQKWMWQTFFHNPQVLIASYLVLLTVLFALYWQIVALLRRSSLEFQTGWKQHLLIYGLLIAPLLFSYNALSHDVFNYIFNAKMIVVYGENPHVSVALNHADDLWVRFMHNTHTPAPYGYGWTALSLIPYLLGFGKFVLTWLSFRLWSLVSVVILYFALQYSAKIFTGTKLQAHQLALVFLNPLFVIEIISTMHNDLWMMIPALLSLAVLTSLNPSQLPQLKKLFLALLLFVVSVSIKWATLALLPLIILIILEKNVLFKISGSVGSKLPVLQHLPGKLLASLESRLYNFIPLIASLLLFIPLFTTRSQQFLPWYLVWVLVWLPFIENKLWKTVILLFSVSSMVRYVPWLWAGNFDGNIILYQKLITWLPVVVYLLWKMFPVRLYQKNNSI